jgi:hypothetical protein
MKVSAQLHTPVPIMQQAARAPYSTEGMEKRKISCHFRESNPGLQMGSLVDIPADPVTPTFGEDLKHEVSLPQANSEGPGWGSCTPNFLAFNNPYILLTYVRS